MNSFFYWRWAVLKNGIQEAMTDRLEFLLELLGNTAVPILVQFLIWNAMFQNPHVLTIHQMSYHDLVHYTLVSILFNLIRSNNPDMDLQELIRTGQLSHFLLKPVDVIQFTYLRSIGIKLVMLTVCLCIGYLFRIQLGITQPTRLFGGLLLAFMGNIIHYQLGVLLASTGFIWEEAFHLLFIKNMVASLLSGETLPLDLFPQPYETLWKITPFYFSVFGPTQYLLGRWSHTEFLYHLGLSGIWFVGCASLIRMAWRAGLKRYTSIGN